MSRLDAAYVEFIIELGRIGVISFGAWIVMTCLERGCFS